ncbi:MAG: DUF4239 domain-containing protein [Thermodesulfovibrionia bacterium]|nr:DUF4239 domain-containing protein [Thermodesulfovibrionia bacterium]
MTGWMHTVVQWPLSMSVIIIMALSVAVPWLAVCLIRRIWQHPAFKENNELVGFTYAVYGLIYGVLLAFTIVVAWQRFETTEKLVMYETTLLSELWRDSITARPFIRDDIQKNLTAYTRSVIDDEWPAMAASGKAHPKTEAIYEHLWAITYIFEPKTKIQETYMNHYLGRMNELSGTRRLRILHSRMEVHSVLWMVLLIGAVPTVAYSLLFSSKHAWVQIVIMGCIMLIVMLGLLVTLSLQHPFSGDVRIEPEAFRDLLDSFHMRLAAPVSVGP